MSASDYPPRPSPIAPGYRLDRYEMLCPIAEGGMASVWIARLRGKRGFEKLVAIKTILPKYAQDSRFQRMFLDEAGLAARIEHVNVAQVLDLGEEHEVLYLSMELVDGDSLSKLLRVVQKKDLDIPPGVVLRILADTCGGLHAAHEVRGRDGELLGVVHRDVSPQNILVTMHGVAKLIDFGIAKARDRLSDDTSEGMLKGKIQFMAPEQALGKPVDRRADVFAVGAIIYFLLSGKPPFAGDNEAASLFLLSSKRPPLPLGPEIHPAVKAVVMKALSYAQEARFATAAEMQTAIEEAMVEAGLVTTTATVATFVQEHMGERSRRRKEGIDLALSAAAHREKVALMLEKAGSDSASGHGSSLSPSGLGSLASASYSTVLLGAPSAHIVTPTTGTTGALAPLADTIETAAAQRPKAGGRKAVMIAAGAAVFATILGVGLVVVPKKHPPPAFAAARPTAPAVQAPAAVTATAPAPSSSALAVTVDAALDPAAAAAPAAVIEFPATSASTGVAAGSSTAPTKASSHRHHGSSPAPSGSAPVKERVDDGF